ncbi:uncharacterized protein N7459_009963 [Penicillium hispanicum]|uniref:uncharacterized protein n=1 Tax=Penicillium hispanicum TaxID=1080232 RepID=UPI002541AAFE|nr:uncharacterized protein N7459_009963 [Penicillium hispanicum]KAJ5570533.1 hypothetical protein N7459_009963 [Penicillium hispanicum]
MSDRKMSPTKSRLRREIPESGAGGEEFLVAISLFRVIGNSGSEICTQGVTLVLGNNEQPWFVLSQSGGNSRSRPAAAQAEGRTKDEEDADEVIGLRPKGGGVLPIWDVTTPHDPC